MDAFSISPQKMKEILLESLKRSFAPMLYSEKREWIHRCARARVVRTQHR